MSKLAVADLSKNGADSNKLAQIQNNKKPMESLSSAAQRLGVQEEELGAYLSEYYQLPYIDLEDFEVDREAIQLLTGDQCRKYRIMPISRAAGTVVIAFADPSNLFMRDDLAYITKCKIEPVVATEKSIKKAQDKYYPDSHKVNDLFSDIEEVDEKEAVMGVESAAGDAPVIKFVNAMFYEAVKGGVSDIHIEVYEKSVRVRFRKDGQLIEKYRPPVSIGSALSSRIKVLAKLDLAERRKPQDGRIKLRFKEKGEVDFRVNIMPVVDGEKVVMRLLDKSKVTGIKLLDLGFDESQLATLKAAIDKPQGLILVTGPTGSGKTTTLYASLQEINDPSVNISTAEDPVEYKIEGMNQTQINADINYNFAEALRAFLRQDPDVILVGEIRDTETAEIAFKAASTGHLVLSTLHTNDSPGTVSRLLEMGIPGYLITATVELVLAQRLVGKICSKCKREDKITPDALVRNGIKESDIKGVTFYRGAGCDDCLGTGIKGRVAVYEFMVMTDFIKEAIMKSATPLELKKAAISGGMKTLRQSALDRAKKGIISLTEVIQGTMKDPA